MLFADLSNEELLVEVSRLAMRERQATAALIRCLIEVDARRLYLGEGYSSLFTFCTQSLHLSEHAALGRIEVARAARRLPSVLVHLENGSVTVTNARMLAPHMTEENCEELLAAARHRSKREVEEIVARLRPQPDVCSTVRKLPSPRVTEKVCRRCRPVRRLRRQSVSPVHPQASSAVAPPVLSRSLVVPLAPERYKIQFSASRQMHEKLRYAQNLLRHLVPNGDVAAVFDRALSALIDQLEKQKCAATSRSRGRARATGSRHIPAAVRREVWRRDEGRCAFLGARGRCTERGFLEFHHVVPFAVGGAPDANNIELRCRAHNLYEADLFFGGDVVRESAALWELTRSGRTELTPKRAHVVVEPNAQRRECRRSTSPASRPWRLVHGVRAQELARDPNSGYHRGMTRRVLLTVLSFALCAPALVAQRPAAPKSPLVERVGDTGFIQLQSPSFASSTTRRRSWPTG